MPLKVLKFPLEVWLLFAFLIVIVPLVYACQVQVQCLLEYIAGS